MADPLYALHFTGPKTVGYGIFRSFSPDSFDEDPDIGNLGKKVVEHFERYRAQLHIMNASVILIIETSEKPHFTPEQGFDYRPLTFEERGKLKDAIKKTGTNLGLYIP